MAEVGADVDKSLEFRELAYYELRHHRDTPIGLERHIKSRSSYGGCAFDGKAECMVSAGPYKGDVSHCGHYVLMARITVETELEDQN